MPAVAPALACRVTPTCSRLTSTKLRPFSERSEIFCSLTNPPSELLVGAQEGRDFAARFLRLYFRNHSLFQIQNRAVIVLDTEFLFTRLISALAALFVGTIQLTPR